VPVKANQPTLFQHLIETYLAQPPQDRHHTHEIGLSVICVQKVPLRKAYTINDISSTPLLTH